MSPYFDIEPGFNPQAEGVLTFGVEGRTPPAFSMDTSGNMLLNGSAVYGGQRGTIVNWIGDSIAPQMSSADFQAGSGSTADFLQWAHLFSNGRLGYGKPAGIVGNKASEMAARIVPDALSSGGHWCGINSGSNDASNAVSVASYAASIRSMVAAIRAAGMRPLLSTPVPNPSASGQRALQDGYRRFVTGYAMSEGLPIVDFHSVLVDPATGGYLAAYDNGDGIHPSPAGKKVMGAALAATLEPYLPPVQLAFSGINTGSTSANILDNSLFNIDTNADGVPDTWTKAGAVAASRVVDAAILGYGFRLLDAASSGYTQCNSPFFSAVALRGHRVLFTGRVKQVGTASTSLLLATNGAATNLSLKVLNNWNISTDGWCGFYLTGVVPTDATSIFITYATSGGASADSVLAQVGIYDLTALGL